MTLEKIRALVASLVGIVLAGGAGTAGAWLVVGTQDWPGLVAGIVGVLLAMVIAVLVFAGGVALLKAIGWIE